MILIALVSIFGVIAKATAEDGKATPISLELYYAPYCHHSQRVIEYINAQKIKLKLVNVANDDVAKKNLKEKGGQMMVPCLFIDGRPLYDDEEIIQWLQKNQECLDLSE